MCCMQSIVFNGENECTIVINNYCKLFQIFCKSTCHKFLNSTLITENINRFSSFKHKKALVQRLVMDLFNATNDLTEAINKLSLWNESSGDLQDYEILNNLVQSEKKDIANQVLNGMLSNETSDYDILNKALDCGYINVAYFMLEKGCKVNKISFVPSFTPLHNAVKLGDTQIVKKLLEKGASVTDVNSNRYSPLCLAYNIAFISEDYQIVDLLLTHIEETSSYTNVKNQHGLSHLHIAAARGNTQVVKKFIEAGVSLFDFVYDTSPTHAGYTALEFACDKKCLDTIKICRQGFPDKKQISFFVSENLNKDSTVVMSELFKYLDNPYQFIIKLSYKYGEDYNQLSHFHLVCFTGNLSSVKKLLDSGEDVNVAMSRNADYTPLYTALDFALESVKQRFEKVKLLIDHDADVYKRNGFCMTALHLAMYTHDWEETNSKDKKSTIELLYSFVEDKEANPMDSNGLTYFHIAVAVNDFDLVKRLLVSGEDPNQSLLNDIRNFSNYTPLHFAARYNRVKIAKLLIDYGAQVNPVIGETPLQIAIEFGCYRMIDLLLEHNVKVNVVKSEKNLTTLLQLVAYYIEKSCSTTEALEEKKKLIGFVEKLVNLGVDVNAKDSDGFTALHNACWNMYNGIWLVECLLFIGADINVKNNKGETPLDVALCCTVEGTYDDFLLLYHHVQRLKALGLEVEANNEEFCNILMNKKEEWKNNDDWNIIAEMYSDETFARKEKERFKEIEKLKRDMITEYVSLYDYLRMDAEQAANYVENERIKTIIKDEAEIFYEVYGYLFSVQYRKSLDWLAAQASKEHDDK